MKKINFKRFSFFKRSWWTDEFCLRIIFVIVFFILFITLFRVFYTPPATITDFQPLYAQKNVILEDSSIVREMDNVVITYSASEIEYNLVSEECNLVFVVDKNSNRLISTTEIDNTHHFLEIFFVSLIIAMGVAAIISAIYLTIMLAIMNLIKFIIKKINKFFKSHR